MGIKNLNGSRDVTTPLSGQFVVRTLGLAMVNMRTTFEVSSLSRFRYILGGLKI